MFQVPDDKVIEMGVGACEMDCDSAIIRSNLEMAQSAAAESPNAFNQFYRYGNAYYIYVLQYHLCMCWENCGYFRAKFSAIQYKTKDSVV